MKIPRFAQIAILLSAGILLTSACNKDAKKSPILSEADLPGHTVATQAGSYYDNKYAKAEGVTPFRVNTEADAIQAVRSGKADVFVTDEVLLDAETLNRTGLKLAFSGAESFPCAMAFAKGDTETLPLFNEFLRLMKEQGALDAHINFWIHGGEPAKYPEPKGTEDDRPVRYITCLKTSPVSFIKNNQWTGLDVELVREFAKWCGRPLQILDIDLAAGIMALQTGQADMLSACLFVTEERKKHMDFSDPYYQCHPGFFMLDEDAVSKGSFWSRTKDAFVQSFVTESRWKLITSGLAVTLEITILAIIIGTILGMLYCRMVLSRRKWLKKTAAFYDFLMQGIPTLVLLLIMYYVVLAKSGMSGIAVAVITFALGFAASSGNVMASSISNIPKGQWEAGMALGFTRAQTFSSIVFPQAVRKGIGAYQGHCVSLLKSTSIVGYIAVQDITRASDLLRSRTFEAFAPLLVITVIYFILAWIIRLLLNLALPKKNHD